MGEAAAGKAEFSRRGRDSMKALSTLFSNRNETTPVSSSARSVTGAVGLGPVCDPPHSRDRSRNTTVPPHPPVAPTGGPVLPRQVFDFRTGVQYGNVRPAAGASVGRRHKSGILHLGLSTRTVLNPSANSTLDKERRDGDCVFCPDRQVVHDRRQLTDEKPAPFCLSNYHFRTHFASRLGKQA